MVGTVVVSDIGEEAEEKEGVTFLPLATAEAALAAEELDTAEDRRALLCRDDAEFLSEFLFVSS